MFCARIERGASFNHLQMHANRPIIQYAYIELKFYYALVFYPQVLLRLFHFAKIYVAGM